MAAGGGFAHRMGAEIESALLNNAVCFRAQAAYSTNVGGDSIRKRGVHEIRRPEGDGRRAPTSALFSLEGEAVLPFRNPNTPVYQMKRSGGGIHAEQVSVSPHGQEEAGVAAVHGDAGCSKRISQGPLATGPPDPED